jgi:hypothetical protein
MDTIGFLELNSIAKGIEVVDYMLKAADATLIIPSFNSNTSANSCNNAINAGMNICT